MKKVTTFTSLYTILLMLCSFFADAQTGLRNIGAKIIIPSGTYLVINGTGGGYANKSNGSNHGTLDLSGKLILEGNWANNATGGDLLDGSTGKVIFNGSSTQQITGTRTTHFTNVQLNEDVEILAPYTISTALDLYDGSLILGNNDLTISSSASITNYGAGKYIRTGGNGALVLNIDAGGSEVTYPVGTASSYMPVKLQQANGATSGVFKVRIIDGVWDGGESGNDLSLSKECVNKTWLVQSGVGNIDLTMTLQWNISDEVNGFDRQQCYISHYENGSWDTETPMVASGSSPYYVSRSNITSLSPFTVAGDNDGSSLPIELLSFDVVPVDFDAFLSWSTASEINCKGFEILRSFNGTDFQKAAYVEGNGNSNIVRNYTFTDLAPTNNKEGLVYYKLKQLDNDGSFKFTLPKAVRFENNNSSIQIFPNPVKDILNIASSDDENLEICIYSTSGQLVMKQEVEAISTINLGNIAPGVYYLKCIGQQEQVNFKVIKQ